MVHTQSSSDEIFMHLPERPTHPGPTWLRSQRTMPPYISGSTLNPLANHCPPTLTPSRLMMRSHQRQRWRQRSDASAPTRQAATPSPTRSTSRCGSTKRVRDKERTPPPPKTWNFDAACGNSPVYVEHWGYSTEIGVYHPGLDPQGKHRHPWDYPPGDLWKFVEAIIDTRLWASIQFQCVLHGFCAVRGTGTATMELKLA